MEDKEIVGLIYHRDRAGLARAQDKYSRLRHKVAYNLLGNYRDSAERANDALHSLWNSIPPDRPDNLAAYFIKIVRRRAVDMYRRQTRQKRGGSGMHRALCELEEALPSREDITRQLEGRRLSEVINDFLKKLAQPDRNIFIKRYFLGESGREIALFYGLSRAKVSRVLARTRKELKIYLEKEGF